MEAPEFATAAGLFSQFVTSTPNITPERRHSLDSNTYKAASAANIGCGGDQFVVEDLLDFPTDDAAVGGEGMFDNVTGSSTDSSTVTAIDSGNSSGLSTHCEPSFNGVMSDATGCCSFANDGQFSTDLCVLYDDMAELEWLSNIVEESFSSEDLQKLHLISGMSSRTADEASETATDDFQPNQGGGGSSSPIFHSDVTVPAKARSKRSRAAPCNWASRLLVLSPEASSLEDDAVIVNATEPPLLPIPPPQAVVTVPSGGKKTARSTPKKKHLAEGAVADGGTVVGREARKCQHCATDTTPQWRTGPMGPKTLCNACGVRYKSGRLVPEYRPAASPTFVLTKHSNSHRKVLELRRQKEMMRTQQQFQQPQQPQFLPTGQNNMVFDAASEDGYLIHQHVCPDFRHLI